jgi:hypothetical protein
MYIAPSVGDGFVSFEAFDGCIGTDIVISKQVNCMQCANNIVSLAAWLQPEKSYLAGLQWGIRVMEFPLLETTKRRLREMHALACICALVGRSSRNHRREHRS